MKDFRNLRVWQKAHALALSVYRTSAGSPREERYGLTAQIRRASVSVPSNIAEGCGRRGADLGRFMQIAMGSASELEYQLLLARDLEFLQASEYARLDAGVTEVKRMLASLIAKLRANR